MGGYGLGLGMSRQWTNILGCFGALGFGALGLTSFRVGL